jgi:hypothetical protein
MANDQLGVHGPGAGVSAIVRQKAANEIAVSDDVQPVENEPGHSKWLQEKKRLAKGLENVPRDSLESWIGNCQLVEHNDQNSVEWHPIEVRAP